MIVCLLGGCAPTAVCPAGLTALSDGGCFDPSADAGDSGRAGDANVGIDGASTNDAHVAIDAFVVPDANVDACVLTTYYRDADMDGHGDLAMPTSACAPPAGYVVSSDDCNDACAGCHPGATEICNAIDDDCNGMIDDGITVPTWYVDADHDGYGATAGAMLSACTMPAGYVSTNGDCDDASASVHPGVTELCDAVDNDCNGTVDNGFPCALHAMVSCSTTCGTMGTGLCDSSCTAPSGLACTPPAETCNGLDENCTGAADENLASSLGPATTAIAAGTTTATTFNGAHLVRTATGYVAFGQTRESPPHVTMQVIQANGTAMGAAIPLDSGIQPPASAPFSVRAAGTGFVIGYGYLGGGTTGQITVASVSAAGTRGTLGSLTLPSGFAGYTRVVVADADATSATVYASLRSSATPITYSIRRYRVGTSGATPSVTSSTDVVTDLAANAVFNVVSTSGGDYIAYVDTSGSLRMVLVSPTGTPGPLGLFTGLFNVGGVALAIGDPTAAVSTTNPLGVAWLDSAAAPAPTTHFIEVRQPITTMISSQVVLSGGTGRSVLFPPPNWVDVVAVPNASTATHAGHWFVVSSDSIPGGTAERAWEVVAPAGGGATLSATALTVPTPAGAVADIALAVGTSGVRFAQATTSGALVTRQIGCR